MTQDTDDLAAIFVNVSGTGTVIERQEESPSHAPIEEADEVPDLTRDGLEDAVDASFEHSDGN
jgi:hypothetical protein